MGQERTVSKELLRHLQGKRVFVLKLRDGTPGQEELPWDFEERMIISCTLGAEGRDKEVSKGISRCSRRLPGSWRSGFCPAEVTFYLQQSITSSALVSSWRTVLLCLGFVLMGCRCQGHLLFSTFHWPLFSPSPAVFFLSILFCGTHSLFPAGAQQASYVNDAKWKPLVFTQKDF